jgi:hypothetical protein
MTPYRSNRRTDADAFSNSPATRVRARETVKTEDPPASAGRSEGAS